MVDHRWLQLTSTVTRVPCTTGRLQLVCVDRKLQMPGDARDTEGLDQSHLLCRQFGGSPHDGGPGPSAARPPEKTTPTSLPACLALGITRARTGKIRYASYHSSFHPGRLLLPISQHNIALSTITTTRSSRCPPLGLVAVSALLPPAIVCNNRFSKRSFAFGSCQTPPLCTSTAAAPHAHASAPRITSTLKSVCRI